jgi:LacI family transcriptional regulator
MPRPTIRDVAEHAGVSPAMVSGVLNRTEGLRVAPATAERVRVAAAALGYTPNSLAQSLLRQRTNTIGLISDTIATTPFAVRMVEAAQQVATARGYLLFLVNTGGDADVERAAITALNGRRVDGFLCASMGHQEVAVPPGLQPPAVFLDARPTPEAFPAVVPDELAGARAAVTELLRHGHRRIGYLNDRVGPVAAHLRLLGYREALAEYGITYDQALIEYDLATPEGGRDATARLIDREDVTALFCFNDRMAMGAYHCLHRRGLRIPEDFSVVGYDDQELVAAYLEPPLTTVALPYFQMGEWGARTLIDLIEEDAEELDTIPVLMPCELVRRQSVGPPPV